MNYINLNRLLTAGAAALLLSLPMTACRSESSLTEPDAQSTGTATSAEEPADTAASSLLTGETAMTPDGTEASDAGTAAAISAADGTAASITEAHATGPETGSAQQTAGTTGTKARIPDSTAPLISGDALTASAGDKRVAVPVTVRNNPGFAMIGISLHYDEALTCLMTASPAADFTLGDAAEGINVQCFVNPQRHMVGLGGIHTGILTADGTVFTCYFDIPESAQSGQVYQFSPEITYVTDLSGNTVPFETADFTLTVR